MITKRTIGTWGAVGGFAAAIALLTGLPTMARADELSDLRANNQLLQQRLDQISQAQQVAAAPPMAGGMMAGSFPHSFLVPGTDTSLAITGFVNLNTDYYISGGAQGGNATTDIGEFGRLLSVGVSKTNGPSQGSGHALTFYDNESRFRIESRTPTAWGPAGTVFEFDFNGGNNPGAATLHPGESLTPRLRLAYGTWGGWLAGQAYSQSLDLDSHTDVIDFGGDVTTGGTVRVPQLRYTYDLGNGMTLSTSIEAPDTTAFTAAGAVDNSAGGSIGSFANVPVKNNLPDVFEGWNIAQPWGHVRFTGVIRDLQFKEVYASGAGYSKEYIGYGGWFTGNVLPGWFGWSRDFIGWGVVAGEGMGRYIGNQYGLSSNFTGLATQAPGSVIATTNTAWGGYLGYKHWWAQDWASDFSGGIAHTDYNTTLLGPTASDSANKELITAHVNLFWYPTSFIHVGLEYMYGHRQVASNLNGNLNVIETEFQVKF
jgi:Porin subfamily